MISFAMMMILEGNEKYSSERCPSGLRSTLGKRVYVNSVSRVRIPLSPPFIRPYLIVENAWTNKIKIVKQIKNPHKFFKDGKIEVDVLQYALRL